MFWRTAEEVEEYVPQEEEFIADLERVLQQAGFVKTDSRQQK